MIEQASILIISSVYDSKSQDVNVEVSWSSWTCGNHVRFATKSFLRFSNDAIQTYGGLYKPDWRGAIENTVPFYQSVLFDDTSLCNLSFDFQSSCFALLIFNTKLIVKALFQNTIEYEWNTILSAGHILIPFDSF